MASDEQTAGSSSKHGGEAGEKDSDIKNATPETLQEAERTLSDLLTRKKAVDKTLMELERKIYLFEGSYLEDTNQYGNIIRGFDGYLNNQSNKKRQKLTEEDRLFSRSSVTYPKALEMKERSVREDTAEDDKDTGSYRGTPAPGSSRLDRTKKSVLKNKRKSSVVAADSDTPTAPRRKKARVLDDDE